MKIYLLKTTRGADLRITEAQKKIVMEALAQNKTFIQLEKQDALVMLNSIVQIIPEEIELEEENKKLSSMGKFKCRYGLVHNENAGCYCWEQKKDEREQSIIPLLPSEIQEGLKRLSSKMTMPSVSAEEIFNERVATGEPRAVAATKKLLKK